MRGSDLHLGDSMEFRLPALGEGIDAATVVGVRVKPGDAVTAGQDVIDVETDKAAVSVPADAAGTVAEVKVKAGDKIPVGGVLLIFASGGRKPPVEPAKNSSSSESPKAATQEANRDLTPTAPPQPNRLAALLNGTAPKGAD